MRRGLAMGLALGLMAQPAQALESTLRLGMPYFLDPGVGGLFPAGQRVGGGAEWSLAGPWSVSLDTSLLHQAWGETRYTLSLTPVLFRYRQSFWDGSHAPFVSLGAGGAAMTLAGGSMGFRVGMGPALAAGVGMPLPGGMLAQVELQQGAIQSIHYLGLAFSLGLRLGSLTPSRMRTSGPPVAHKPPLPQGRFLQVGKVSEIQGDRLRFAIDDLPYGVRPGDTLLVYYQDDLPIKVAKIRVESLDPSGRMATGVVLAATEAIRRGYLLATF